MDRFRDFWGELSEYQSQRDAEDAVADRFASEGEPHPHYETTLDMLAEAAMEDDVQSLCGHCGEKTDNPNVVFYLKGSLHMRLLCNICVKQILEWI